MATFIPEWTTRAIGGRDVKLRSLLATLDASFVVRRPLPRLGWAPDLFIQHPQRGWLAIAISDAEHGTLTQAQLFQHDDVEQFERLLARFGHLEGVGEETNRALTKVVLLWSCSRKEARSLAGRHRGTFDGLFLSRESLTAWGGKLLVRLLAPLRAEAGDELALLGRFFPEAEIPAACATRRYLHRDNSARLTPIFLDPQQELASKLDLDLSPAEAAVVKDLSVRLVNGVAGSGKTLIALKRAMLLGELFPSRRILLLIHNTPIVADLRARLRRAYGGIPANVLVTTFFSWAAEQWHRMFSGYPKVPPQREILALIAQLTSGWPAPRLPGATLLDELDFIDDALIADERQYREASRAGRGFSLRPKERSQIWTLHQQVTRALAERGWHTWSGIPQELCGAPDGGRLERYEHVLIDEAQFFAPSWFELVKRSLAPQGRLFLCADPNQGFLKQRLSWKRAGLDVAGRTRKLRKAYRTTGAILRAASRILAQPIPEDAEEFLQPDFAGMEPGRAPLLVQVGSPQDAVDRVANEVKEAVGRGGLRLSDLLVVYGDAVSKSLLHARLCDAVGPRRVWWLNKAEQKRQPPHGDGGDYLRMAYLDSATGLEGDLVFLLGAERVISGCALPEVGLTYEEHAARREASTRKLYMAMTRAGRQLVVVTSERPPPRVAEAFEPQA